MDLLALWTKLDSPNILKTENINGIISIKLFSKKKIQKESSLRKQSALSDYYLGSVHALLSETGELVIASNSGSQLPHLVFTSPNIILVVGTQKITSTLDEAIKHLMNSFPSGRCSNEKRWDGWKFHSKLYSKSRTIIYGRKVQ